MDNFIVSARKYRPATFISVIGQSHITSTLKNAISRNQLAHAYLFCGPRGVGKTTCARIFAKAINCLDPKDAEACNECESCKAFNEGRSFNIHELDAASNNSVDDIRNLTDQVRIPPQIGRYSVYIIDEVHMLSLQAFNAFLKTLEEPPAHAVFILATTEKHKIIPTILSRCQIYDFNRIRVEDSVGYLKYIAGEEGVTYDEESLHIIAQKADGGMRDALSMFDKVVSFSGSDLSVGKVAETLNVLDYDTYFRVTEQILAGDYTSVLMLFDDVLRKGFSGQTFVSGLNNHFRDLLMCKNPQTIPLLEVTGVVAERYKAQAAACGVPLLFGGIDLLTALDASFRTATNQRLHVELGLMKLCGLGQKKNSDALIPSLPPLDGARKGAPDSKAASRVAPEVAGIAAPVPVPAPDSTPEPTPTPAPVLTAASPTIPVPTVPAPVPSPVPASPEGKGLTSGAETESSPSSSSDALPAAAPPTIPAPDPIPAPEPVPASPAIPAPVAARDSAPVTAPAPRGFSFSGASIGSLMQNKPAPAHEETGEAAAVEPETPGETDDITEERLIKGCARFAKEISTTRPRLGVAFQEVTVTGNTVSIRVPNESLHDEVVRNLPEMQKHLAELSMIHGPIRFEITVDEAVTGLKPVKVEDRLRFLTEKNPLLTQLRKDLDLDVE